MDELWKAYPHKWGPGKIHEVDPDSRVFGPLKLLCGRLLNAVPGEWVENGTPASCQKCLEQMHQREWELQREAENREWWARYDAYMASPAWKRKHTLVLDRAHGICEGCGLRRAVQVHHLTYRHLCAEYLWELRAVCLPCHDRIHAENKEPRMS